MKHTKMNIVVLTCALFLIHALAHSQGRGEGRVSAGKGRDGGSLNNAQIMNYLRVDNATQKVPLKRFVKEYIEWTKNGATLNGTESQKTFQGLLREGLKDDIDPSPYKPLKVGACYDKKLQAKMATALRDERGGEICFSVELIANALNPNLANLIALAIHEHAHHFGDADDENILMADVALDAAKFLAEKYPAAKEPNNAASAAPKVLASITCQSADSTPCPGASDKSNCTSAVVPIYQVYSYTDGTSVRSQEPYRQVHISVDPGKLSSGNTLALNNFFINDAVLQCQLLSAPVKRPDANMLPPGIILPPSGTLSAAPFQNSRTPVPPKQTHTRSVEKDWRKD